MKHRTVVAAGVLAVLTLAGGMSAGPVRAAASLSVSLPSASVDYQLDAAHDGHADDTELVAPLTKAWSFAFPGVTSTAPLVVGDVVFVAYPIGQSGGDSEGVQAFDAATGGTLWGPVDLDAEAGIGALAYVSGRLFAVDDSVAPDVGAEVTALDAGTGGIDWQTKLPQTQRADAPPVAYGGSVYVPTDDDVFALDAVTGAVKWRVGDGYEETGTPAIDASGLYLSSVCRYTERVSFAGAIDWVSKQPQCQELADEVDVLHDGDVYTHAGDVGDNREAFVAPALSEATGGLVGSILSGTPPAFESHVDVGVSRGRVSANNVQSGVNLWNTPDDDYALPALLVNGYAVVADTAGDVRLLDEQTGVVDWSGSVGDSIGRSDEDGNPELIGLSEGDGRIAVASDNRLTVFVSSSMPAPHVHITGGPSLDTFTAGGAVYRFDSDVPSATYECTIDGHASACHSPFSVSHLAAGPHVFSVALAGNPAVSDRRQFDVDVTSPTVVVARHSARAFNPTALFGWSGTDGQSAVANFDVRQRVVSPSGDLGQWARPRPLQHEVDPVAQLPIASGSTLCVSVRSRDLAGNVSPWSRPTCTTAVVDDSSPAVHVSHGWTKYSAPGYHDETYRQATTAGATLALRNLDLRSVNIAAVRCPTCGAIQVSFAGHRATVNLTDRTTGVHAFKVMRLPHSLSGTLRIRTLSRQKVDIDDISYTWRAA